MLFLLFGSSAGGKTFALNALRELKLDLAIHDFDEIGVPPGADWLWRQRSNEAWVRRGLGYQRRGIDFLLASQTPLGELLATPSAPLLEGISACLIDCDDRTRLARLRARGPEWLARTDVDLQDYLNWAAWMRRHAEDPQFEPEVIRRDDDLLEMHWDRWSGWQTGDPRWQVRVIDTSIRAVEQVADELSEWIEAERVSWRSGGHPSQLGCRPARVTNKEDRGAGRGSSLVLVSPVVSLTTFIGTNVFATLQDEIDTSLSRSGSYDGPCLGHG